MARRIGVLTGGGDCPGLNAAIRAIVRRGRDVHGWDPIGFHDGWRGVVDANVVDLTPATIRGILPRGGTILGSSGFDPFRAGGAERVREVLRDLRLDGSIAIGGEGTLGLAARLADDGVPIVGIPKTIDNDLAGTDACIGFATAVQVATDAIDRLHTTAESHNRVMLLEVMGRDAGWIAVDAGVAGGAHLILAPEIPFDPAAVVAALAAGHRSGRSYSIVVVAEGATPVAGTFELPPPRVDERGFPRYGGIAQALAPALEEATGFETRVVVLGHLQRGGSPVAADRILASRLGVAAVDLVEAGTWGRMVGLHGGDVVAVDLHAGSRARPVPTDRLAVAGVFGA
ncbi:MAG: 6-phosphofructokinase [Actinomycetota bacterium]